MKRNPKQMMSQLQVRDRILLHCITPYHPVPLFFSAYYHTTTTTTLHATS